MPHLEERRASGGPGSAAPEWHEACISVSCEGDAGERAALGRRIMRDTSSVSGQARRDRLLRELVHDPYKSKRKLSEPTVCPDCSAVYEGGRWQWKDRPAVAVEVVCPACDRARDKYPAGRVTIEGPFAMAHREEILNLAWGRELKAKAQHPLDRILRIEETPSSVVIETTDIHLPRAIGEALHRAYEGKLDYRYPEEEYYLEVRWSR